MGLTWSLWTSGKDIFYGRHEVEQLRAEANAISKPNCDKVNGCRDMIPVYDFTRDNLPDPYNKINDVYELTQALAYLTVRLKCQYISEKRPRYIPGTEQDDYPLHDLRGKWEPTTGTGRVCDVVKGTFGKCTCQKCILSANPKSKWWEIKIFTATHVVHDELEAKETTCSLFYDWEKNEERVDLVGCKKKWLHVDGDLCLLSTLTHEEELATKLFNKIKEFNTYWKSLKVMYEKDKRKEQLVIIVSHPHGKAKHISVGKGVDVGTINNLGYNKYIYTTPTCPGTSGGPVYVLGYDWFLTEFVHGGTLLSNGTIQSETSSIGLKSFSEYVSLSKNSVSTISYSSSYKTEQTKANKNKTPQYLDQTKVNESNTPQHLEQTKVNESNTPQHMEQTKANENNTPQHLEQTKVNESNTPQHLDQKKANECNTPKPLEETEKSNHDMNTDSTIEPRSVYKSADSKMCKFSNYSARWY